MHLFFYVRLLAFLLLNVSNKITDGNLLKAKLGIYIKEQGPQVLRFFGRGLQIIKVLKFENHWPNPSTYFINECLLRKDKATGSATRKKIVLLSYFDIFVTNSTLK